MDATTHTKYTVLIVDDMPENIQVLSSVLYQRGINIAIAQNGPEALNIVLKKAPDLILLDIMMPEMDGFAVCERIQANPAIRHIPVIFLTGRIQADDVVRGFECGAVDYITKPFNPAELLSRVFTHLELKRARDIITAQNRQLAEQNQALNELNASKDKFFSIIAHDLRNPFNALLSLTSLLNDELPRYSREDIARYVSRIHQASEHSYALLENLLEWSRSQTGRLQFTPQTAYLNLLARESMHAIEQHASEKQIRVSTEVPAELAVFADVKMLATILRNLLSNAVKFTPPGGRVTVEAWESDTHVQVQVRDTGLGIKSELLPQIFRIDIHHSTPGTADEKGSGLGLILCKEFAEKHGGTITVASEYGVGSAFTVSLPKQPAA